MGGSRPSAAVYPSPSSPESCPASSEAMATRTEWSRRAPHDGYIFIESETRPRRGGRAIDFVQHIVAIDRCSAHMLYEGGRPFRPHNRFLLPHFTLR